ncbi:hypothetical protein N7489_003391 [Penicillium chrysogenum]|uniref:Uncharacterized protein n=1 Tax=Penicillium chrysogenum TaxID=5076 RepID=A0ABQ8W8F4_PENCH|nr:uncharacterized protein N7489_003391 [Penicillium chrysogenum]XP_061069288.1 uncharacterized protein N7525_009790 [Penicillium rubens]KAJ5252981.1 hypothetical protein N7489_003391 [Penicillium chrysogenum]KAJ5260209.1 hypothetical protein N7505_009590 [Penicillium chrysogenum]KAJ5831537.1 hypothetical protein N7525_009790 [Penicillium rubens]KAJ5855085.1 hypothetical protein N7534_007628 [Penicillium rubens]KAJ6141866.1 hypothetical protein N7497_010965 [Penicillium chrysogenum]
MDTLIYVTLEDSKIMYMRQLEQYMSSPVTAKTPGFVSARINSPQSTNQRSANVDLSSPMAAWRLGEW